MDPSSKNWLFFGERNQSLDFYYQNELTHLETQGSLKLSLAFSRDQEKKVYVQDKLLEHKLQLWDWVKNGAYIYICGDAKSMAKDVLHALSEIFASEGALSEEQVKAYLLQLRKTKQLQMDVY
jgi:sulfite reductase alpha subunit-like flavoprotein